MSNKDHPIPVHIVERYPLTKPGSSKHTFHIGLAIKGKGVHYQVGDSLAVYAQNDPSLVQHLIDAMKATGDEQIIDKRTQKIFSLRDFLTFRANLSRLTSSFLKLFYEHETLHDRKNRLHHLLQPESKTLLKEYLSQHDPLDLFKEYHSSSTPLDTLCEAFGPLLPRFYSIASSLLLQPDQLDLVVALSSYTHAGELRYGVASHFLSHLATPDTPIPVYVQPAHGFTLPDNPTTPIIMIGPGTGVAPFRAFLQERLATGATGKNWLFFGERNRATDYFYSTFWESLVRSHHLRLDLAFSRDQPEKIYVQNHMLSHGAALWDWLQNGAILYVCGDAHHMAKDVERTLLAISISHGNLSEEAARHYLKSLRTSKRYLLDVY